MNANALDQARRVLDGRFAELRPLTKRLQPPVRGWIKAIREALGMSAEQLAKRLQVKQPTIVAMEQSELKGTIQLQTLRRVAEAMDCKLIYVLVPNDSLENIVTQQARKVVKRRLRSVEHSMKLEDQAVSPETFEARIDALARSLKPRAVWDET